MAKAKKVVKKATSKKDPNCKNCEATGLAPTNLPKNERHICPECKGSGKV